MDHTELKEKIKKRIKVNPKTNCWEWQGCKNNFGYGQIRHRKKTIRVHRIMIDVKPGECALHRCDNPSCCNPDHLYIGNRFDNMKDKFKRDRASHIGSKNPRSKLTEHDVYGIKILLKNKKVMDLLNRDIAKLFNISLSTIDNIDSEYTWSHVTI